MRKLKRFLAAFMAMAALCLSAVTAWAYGYSDMPAGTYRLSAGLSCYVTAMGGVEFGAPLLVSAEVTVAPDGSKTMTLYFTKSSVTIYSVTCDTFVDVSPSYVTDTNGVQSGTLGYYDADGVLVTEDVGYTQSADTAENAQGEQVHYVDSMTFPIRYESGSYQLSIFVNSNVMGTQFTADGYAATLTVDWSSVSAESPSQPDNTPAQADDTPAQPASTPAQQEPAVQEPAAGDSGVESKDGLHIYPAGEEPKGETAEDTKTDAQTGVNGTYIAFFKEPLLIAVGIAACVMIAAGAVLVAVGRKERKA